jgi:SagB-type dehydrogenase family enzyme
LSAALEYHRATNYPPGAWEDEANAAKRYVGPKPAVFRDYGDAERLPLETLIAGPLLGLGAGVVRSQGDRDYGGGTMHWRSYSSAGGLFPVEAYVAAPEGLYSFDPLTPGLVQLGGTDVRGAVAEAVGAEADTFVVLTGVHGRTGWKYLERGYRHIWWDAGTMLANLLALAAAEGLAPRLYTAFVDGEVNDAVGADGTHEYALAVLVLDSSQRITNDPQRSSNTVLLGTSGSRFPLAERAHQASSLSDKDAVRAWRVEPEGEEPTLDRERLAQSMRSRTSIRKYADSPLPRVPLDELLAWSEAPIPADAPRVVQQLVTVAAVEGLDPGIYDASLNLLHARDEQELRERAWFVAMEQDHPKLAAVNVFQLADLPEVVERLGDRGYRWAQLEAGIRAGRLQVGAFMRGWGAAASTFYDEEVSRFLETLESPMLMVAIGPRLRPRPQVRL